MMDYIREAPVELRCHLIGSIFSEKIEFDGIKYRTSKLNEAAALIFQYNSELKNKKGTRIAQRPIRYRGRDLNPHSHHWPKDFKSFVSTDSTTAARLRIN